MILRKKARLRRWLKDEWLPGVVGVERDEQAEKIFTAVKPFCAIL